MTYLGDKLSVMSTNPLDQKILRYAATRSPEEISELLDGVVTPEEVMARKTVLMKDRRKWVSDLERWQLLMDKLWEICDTYHEWAIQGSIKSADMVLKSVTQLRAMIQESRMDADAAKKELSRADAEKLGAAMALSFELLLRELKIPEEEAAPILERVLEPAFAQIEGQITDG